MSSIHQPEYIEFVSRLRNERKARGLTQAQLAALLGRPQSYVSKVETCERRLDLVETARWCNALGIGIDRVIPPELAGRTSKRDDV